MSANVNQNPRPATYRMRQGRIWATIGGIGATLFGLVHVYWALGGRIGIDEEMGEISDRLWFLTYDIAAGVVFLGFGAIGVILGRKSVSEPSRSRLIAFCWWGGILSSIRGGAALVQDAFVIDEVGFTVLFDLIFTVGGLLFMRAARLLRNP